MMNLISQVDGYGCRSDGCRSGRRCCRSWPSWVPEVPPGRVLVVRTPSWYAWHRGVTDVLSSMNMLKPPSRKVQGLGGSAM
jgi:hypothetical protein